MSDYFDQVGREIRQAARRRVHLPWYRRLTMPGRPRALVLVFAALVLATPAVAAVSGVFSPGKPDVFYPASSTTGLGKALAGSHVLSLRAGDPDGGPPWGMRLVSTDRGDTCVQVGRVEFDELGSLGIDYSWGNDHHFHAINPNDSVADICGATDSAGHGFVSASWHLSASAYTPSDDGSGTAFSYCQSPQLPPFAQRLRSLPKGSKQRALLEQIIERRTAALAHTHTCPAGSGRMIFTGLLGPEAKSITYTAPSGASQTEATVGADGAYLIVVRQTAANCNLYDQELDTTSTGCESSIGGTEYPQLRLPNAVTSVTYDNGTTCSDEPSASFAAAYKTFEAQQLQRRHETGAEARAAYARFFASQHFTVRNSGQAINPQCPLVGFVATKRPPITAVEVSSPIRFTAVRGTRFCSNGPKGMPYKGTIIACDGKIPSGDSLLEVGAGTQELITASFIAHKAVTTTNSWYEWNISNPGNGGGGGSRTQTNLRKGQRVSFTMFEPASRTGIYTGTVSYMQNAGQSGPQGGDDPGRDGSVIVGRFSFTVH